MQGPARHGSARHGWAWHGEARRGIAWAGRVRGYATPPSTQTHHRSNERMTTNVGAQGASRRGRARHGASRPGKAMAGEVGVSSPSPAQPITVAVRDGVMLGSFFAVHGSHLSDDDARIVGPELYRLTRSGCDRPAAIAEAARPLTSPLHPYFEWDDSAAATHWRESQARKLLQSVTVEVIGTDEPVRAFHAIAVAVDEGEPARRVFRPIDVVAAREEESAQVIEAAGRELRAFRDRYKRYCDVLTFGQRFAPVFAAIDALDEEAN